MFGYFIDDILIMLKFISMIVGMAMRVNKQSDKHKKRNSRQPSTPPLPTTKCCLAGHHGRWQQCMIDLEKFNDSVRKHFYANKHTMTIRSQLTNASWKSIVYVCAARMFDGFSSDLMLRLTIFISQLSVRPNTFANYMFIWYVLGMTRWCTSIMETHIQQILQYCHTTIQTY